MHDTPFRIKLVDLCVKAKNLSLVGKFVCPFLSAISDSFRDFCTGLSKYEQLKFEEFQLNDHFQKNKEGGSVTLVFDAKCGPNTYGDFSKYLLLAKVLQSKFVVKFIIITDNLGKYWRDMSFEEVRILADQYVLLASGVIRNPKINVILAGSFNEVQIVEKFDFLIFRKKTIDRKLDFWNLQWLTILLYQKGWFGNQLLLNKNDFSPPKVSPANPYVVWHIRFGSKSVAHKDDSPASVIENYKQLRNIFGNKIEIVVCSSSAGLLEISKMATVHNLKLTSAREYSQDFSGDIGLAFHAKLFVQLGNGGIYEYFAFSSSKFLLTGADLVTPTQMFRLLIRSKKTPYIFYPWLRESQILASKVYSSKPTFIPPTNWKKISSNLKSRGFVEKEFSSGVSS